ncbi:MAG: histidinol-phosphatase HisJ family protein, partial [Coriobacteriia bacterium]|nr:histidinol-phosphatase HisJ family protein [Coriobacteriia bacterium]
MVLINCHTHTAYSGHGSGTILEHAQAAFEAGIDTFCFTEHMPLPASIDPTCKFSIRPELVESYFAEIEEARKRFPSVHFVRGFEADWYEGADEYLTRYMPQVELVLASLHMLNGWLFDSPKELESWERKNVNEVYEEYFSTWLEMATSSYNFNILSHPDLIKKFGHRPSFDERAFYKDIAKVVAQTDRRIEISTAGLRAPVKEMYPGPIFLEELCKAGVPCVISTDSHHIDQVAYQLSEAYAYARTIGYTSI